MYEVGTKKAIASLSEMQQKEYLAIYARRYEIVNRFTFL